MSENVQPQSARLVFGKLPSGAYAPISLSSTAAVNINGSITASLGGFNSTLDATLAVSGTSARLQLTGTGTAVVIDNSQNSVNAHVAFGNSSVVATTTNQRIPAGDIIAVDSGGQSYVAVILDSGSGNVSISQGAGLLTGVSTPGAGGGGGGNVNITEVGGAAVALGQTTMSASIPVSIASNQAAFPVSINQASPGSTNAVEVTNMPGTLDVNTGNASNDTVRVVLASNQPTVAVSASSLPLPSGAATSALQTTINTTLGSPFQAGAAIGGSSVDLPVLPATDAFQSGTASATTTASTQIIAGVASKSLWITEIDFGNTSAASITVNVQDGSGGTVLKTYIVPAGGGIVVSGGGQPICKTSSGNGLYFTCSAGESTIYANASGFAK